MSDDEPEAQSKAFRWLGLFVGLPIVVIFVLIMLFVMETELAHDETECPFTFVESRRIEDGSVVQEEMRRCQEDVEEHRWRIVRDGDRSELGRRRLPADRYTEGSWHWAAALGERGVHIHIENHGVEDADFHERPGQRGDR